MVLSRVLGLVGLGVFRAYRVEVLRVYLKVHE